jgi:hypothetical protein
MPERYHDGTRVRINNPALREHGVLGTVQTFDAETEWYLVELDKGPPWRGKYEQEEIAFAAARAAGGGYSGETKHGVRWGDAPAAETVQRSGDQFRLRRYRPVEK